MYRQADVIYLYDSSWQGFLTCVFHAFDQKEEPFAIWPRQAARPTLYPVRQIATDPALAERVDASIDTKLGPRSRQLISLAFLHGEEDKELDILRFLQFAYPMGRRAPWVLGHPAVAPLLAREKAVTGEAHLLKGFIRFADYDGFLFARIDPKHYVLPLLKGHFCSRFPEENFLIYDAAHQAALLWQNHRASYQDTLDGLTPPPISRDEARMQQMWKRFYQTLSIRERENPLCRMTHCPKRYWLNMTELQEELAGPPPQ